MRLGLLLPGQGFQRAGILAEKFKTHSKTISPILEEIDSVIHNFRLSTPLLDPDYGRSLTPTSIAQPLILAASYCLFKTWEPEGKIEYAMGHSLGEISAFACAGVLPLEDAIQLVHKRGQAMEEAAKSGTGMMAVLKPRKYQGNDWLVQLQDAAHQNRVSIANFNSESQTVLSGSDTDLANTLDLLKKWHKSVISQKLNVSGAFHSPYMAAAQPELARLVETFPLKKPEFEIISNKTAQPFKDVEEIRASIPEMLVTPVKWQQSTAFLAQNVEKIVSMGPGRVGKMTAKDYKVETEYYE